MSELVDWLKNYRKWDGLDWINFSLGCVLFMVVFGL